MHNSRYLAFARSWISLLSPFSSQAWTPPTYMAENLSVNLDISLTQDDGSYQYYNLSTTSIPCSGMSWSVQKWRSQLVCWQNFSIQIGYNYAIDEIQKQAQVASERELTGQFAYNGISMMDSFWFNVINGHCGLIMRKLCLSLDIWYIATVTYRCLTNSVLTRTLPHSSAATAGIKCLKLVNGLYGGRYRLAHVADNLRFDVKLPTRLKRWKFLQSRIDRSRQHRGGGYWMIYIKNFKFVMYDAGTNWSTLHIHAQHVHER